MRIDLIKERFKDILSIIDYITSDDDEARDEAKTRIVNLHDELVKELLHRETHTSVPRMTNAQRDRLWELCGQYDVSFRETDYFNDSSGMVEGWIGGRPHAGESTTLYVGVEPNGQSHS